ncbi:hypothetical protein GOP47_0016849 [Adiantum capillus-veneris]|uniref:Uncharacterized protein n=1 Tax=Adiantum capillus-veneris TaxID=13818 RepID=A0A9D4UJ83_ADICA|nr:hypothetical protein GOP47_0016849 [Adiantum capillus-veneris]
MRVEEELRMLEMLHEHLNRHGCIPSEQDSDPFWHYCQTLFATRFSVRQLKRKMFAFYRQQTEIMECCMFEAGAETANSEGQNVLTSLPLPHKDQHETEEATVLKESALTSKDKHPSNIVVVKLDSDAEQEFIPSLVRPYSDAEWKLNVVLDNASPLHFSQTLREAARILNKNDGDAASSSNLLQIPVNGATISVKNSGFKLVREGFNPVPDLVQTEECSHLPGAADQLGHDKDMLTLIEGPASPLTTRCHVNESLLELQDPLPSYNTCMEVCQKEYGSGFRSISSSLADVCHRNAQMYGDGSAERKVQDRTQAHINDVADANGDMLSLQTKPDAKLSYPQAISDESVAILQHANLNLRRKRCTDASMLQCRYQIKRLRQSAMKDLAETMIILSQCSLPPQ